jgi:hypothetical protein
MAVVDGVRTLSSGCRIEHLAYWQSGRFRHAADETILRAANLDNLALVTYDVGTVPAILRRWLTEGRPIPPAVFIPSQTLPPGDIGAVARALVKLYRDPASFDAAYPIVYLQPAHRDQS